MDVGRSPGIGVIFPWIGPRSNRQEPVDAVFIRQAAPYAQEVRVERPGPLIPFVEVTTRGISLPDLQEGIGDRIATVVEYAARYNDALAYRLAAGPGVACEIGVFQGNGTEGGSGAGEFRDGQGRIE